MLSDQKTTNTRNNSLMYDFTTELIKNLSNNISVEEISNKLQELAQQED